MQKNDHRYLVIIALYKKAKFCEIKLKYLSREYGKSKFSKFKIIGAIFDTYKLLSRLKKWNVLKDILICIFFNVIQ